MSEDFIGYRREREEPSWVDEQTGEWEALHPGQRYPGDTGQQADDQANGRRQGASGRASATPSRGSAGVYPASARPAQQPAPKPISPDNRGGPVPPPSGGSIRWSPAPAPGRRPGPRDGQPGRGRATPATPPEPAGPWPAQHQDRRPAAESRDDRWATGERRDEWSEPGARPRWDGRQEWDGSRGDARPEWDGQRGAGQQDWDGTRADGPRRDGRPDWDTARGDRPRDWDSQRAGGARGDGRPAWDAPRGDGPREWDSQRASGARADGRPDRDSQRDSSRPDRDGQPEWGGTPAQPAAGLTQPGRAQPAAGRAQPGRPQQRLIEGDTQPLSGRAQPPPVVEGRAAPPPIVEGGRVEPPRIVEGRTSPPPRVVEPSRPAEAPYPDPPSPLRWVPPPGRGGPPPPESDRRPAESERPDTAADPGWFSPAAPTSPAATPVSPAAPVSPAVPVSPAASLAAPVSGPPLTEPPEADTQPLNERDTTDEPADEPVAEASPDTVRPAPAGPAAGAATALGAPTMLAPIVRRDAEPPESEEPAQPAAPDPEQVLASYQWRFHHETLRELVEDPAELREIRDRLTEKLEPANDNRARARLLSLRAVVSRILGDLGKALSDAKLAVTHAEATGELRRIAIAQARLAHVLQWRGDFAEADRLFEEANSAELPDRLRATMHEHAGRSCYDQGRYMEACNHFERALDLRKVEDPDLIARTELALDAVFNKVAQNGMGPYPRTKDEILQIHRPPAPAFSDRVQRWGYAGADGEFVVPPEYADVQPFRDRVAWVRRPEAQTWELIDEAGQQLITASAGYFGVGSFSDGLAWVSRDGTGNWIAIDKSGRIVIPNGFDDVRPFRRGIAAVRKGGWGAVDKTGRVVLPTRFSGFATALTDGRYVDGFTDEGLAIVDGGGRKGVVDRAGRMIVPPVHPAVVIHPVAFLVGNGNGQWGALDRRGEPLIDPVHPSRGDVMDEIDRLLADTKPVL